MNFTEYKDSVKTAAVSEKLMYLQSVLWLQTGTYPLGLISIGGEKSQIIKIPGAAKNRYGKIVPVTAIANSAFAGNENITDIILPSSVVRIPTGAFSGCAALKRVTIPRTVKMIRVGTFSGCVNLEDVYYEGSLEEWKDIEIVHDRHEIEFGTLVPGTPVQSIVAERLVHIPGNEALYAANIHLNCRLGDLYDPLTDIDACGKDVTEIFWAM